MQPTSLPIPDQPAVLSLQGAWHSLEMETSALPLGVKSALIIFIFEVFLGV